MSSHGQPLAHPIWLRTGQLLAMVVFFASCTMACSKKPPKQEPTTETKTRSPGKPATSSPMPITVTENWRLEFPGDLAPQTVVALQGGDLLVAAEFKGALDIPTKGQFTAKGEDDILILQLSSDGTVQNVNQIGGEGDDEVESMTLSGGTPYLAIRTDGPLSVAGQRLSPPEPAEEYLPALLGVAIELDKVGKARRVVASFPNAHRLSVLALPEKGLVASVYYDTGDDAEFSRVQRLETDGETQWETELAKLQVNQLTYVKAGVIAATRGNRELGLVRIDPTTGAKEPLATIQKTPGGDLGSIRGLVALDGALLAYGHTGREPVSKDGKVYSHSIEPFVLDVAGGTKAEKQQLADVTGNVVAVGLLHGNPAAIINVIHHGSLYGGHSPPHRGIYLVIGSESPVQFVPIFQVDFEIDEPEDLMVENPYGQKTVVRGKRIQLWGDSAIAGDAVILVGSCGEGDGVGCVAKYSTTVASE